MQDWVTEPIRQGDRQKRAKCRHMDILMQALQRAYGRRPEVRGVALDHGLNVTSHNMHCSQGTELGASM